ncbi:MAG: phosphoribosylformylglycinamidine synthase I [Nanoarchaeota archaeon]|nr:phosphoribosylformylglycinamidine synthase I [Nanoarchaeota archaeon]
MVIPRVLVMRTTGTNCENETAYAFNKVGADADIVHINTLIKGSRPEDGRRFSLEDYHILAIPGGFSHGDYIKAGKVLAEYIKGPLKESIQQFVDDGKPIIGICNGFQGLVQSGLLPNGVLGNQTSSLTYNDSQRFGCRWVKLTVPTNNSIWLKGIESIDVPVANAEGKYVASEEELEKLIRNGQVALQYVDIENNPTQDFPANPSGSMNAIAGVSDPSGTILGLMPHFERYNHPMNHNLATLQKVASQPYIDKKDSAVQRRLEIAGTLPEEGMGLQIFRNGVDYVIENLLR